MTARVIKRRGAAVKGKAVKLEGQTIHYECPNGHRSRRTFPVRGPKGITGGGLAWIFHWHQSGCYFECRKCLP